MKNLFLAFISIIIFSLWSCDGGVSKYHLGAQKIGLQPYENIDTNHLNIAKEAIEDYYGYDVEILEPIKLPTIARKETKTSYKYDAEKLLIHLKQALPENVTKIVGLTDYNLYAGQNDIKTIVAKSKRPGKVSVISSYQVRKTSNNTKTFESRFKKIVLKEIGHTVGLSSCADKDGSGNCLMMNFGGSGRALDKIDYQFCEKCAMKLNWDNKAIEKE